MKKVVLMVMLVSPLLIPILSSAQKTEILGIGTLAPDFNLPGVDGKTYSLSDYSQAQVLAILFTCNHCPTAQAYEARVKALQQKFGTKGFTLVAISTNDPKSIRLDELGYTDLSDSFEEMKIRAKEQSYNYTYLYDGEDQKVGKAYGPVATPHIFIFDTSRKLRYQGRIDDTEKPGSTAKNKDAENAILALLENKEVPVPNTKTFGCSIKWSDKSVGVEAEAKSWKEEPVAMEKIDQAGLKELISNRTDKVRLINVWATWCGPCVVEFPEFIKMHHMYRNRDFELVTVSADDPAKHDKALKFLTLKTASNKNYIFASSDKYALIEAIDPDWQGALPYTILVEPGGKIAYSKQGQINPLAIRQAIIGSSFMGRYY